MSTLARAQICVCPEYVLVPAHFQDALLAAFTEMYASFPPLEVSSHTRATIPAP